jgi:heme-degrading monooxygenase HmoA
MFVEIRIHGPLEGHTEETRSALHEQARRMKADQGLRQVSVLEETNGDLCLLAIWESRDTWTAARTAREGGEPTADLSSVEAAPPRVLLLEET